MRTPTTDSSSGRAPRDASQSGAGGALREPTDASRSGGRAGMPSGASGGVFARARSGSTGICTFRLGTQRFGLNTALVGEVVSVTALAPVPLVPPAVLGLFNLRGAPIPLLDFAAVLGLSAAARLPAMPAPALVLAVPTLTVAVCIDGMGRVVSLDPSAIVRSGDQGDRLVEGFADAGDGEPVAILSAPQVIARIEALRLRRE